MWWRLYWWDVTRFTLSDVVKWYQGQRVCSPLNECIYGSFIHRFSLWALVSINFGKNHFVCHLRGLRFLHINLPVFCIIFQRITPPLFMQGHKPQFSIVYRLLYKMIVECSWPDCGCWVFISSQGAGKFVCVIKYSSWNRYQSRGVNDVFPPDDPRFDSDTEMSFTLVNVWYLDV